MAAASAASYFQAFCGDFTLWSLLRDVCHRRCKVAVGSDERNVDDALKEIYRKRL
jgi:hypothetical protein